ncbi:MAG: twin-arginine translocation signal domain-containing protein [Candidatus Omnitrophota bacterium]
MDKKITRRDFLKLAGFGVFTVLILPGLKRLNLAKGAHKEARYYKNLAG